MRDLKTLREVWSEIERLERGIEPDLTVEQGVNIFRSLHRAAAPFLAETEELFRAWREVELIELQARLRRLDEWKGNQSLTAQPN
jgi:hypothetical protein